MKRKKKEPKPKDIDTSIEVKSIIKKRERIICPDCKNSFSRIYELIQHKPLCKGNKISRYLCTDCNRWIPTRKKKKHQIYHSSITKPKKTVGTVYSPKEIIPTPQSPIGCAKCDQIMTSKKEHEDHKNTCVGKDDDTGNLKSYRERNHQRW